MSQSVLQDEIENAGLAVYCQRLVYRGAAYKVICDFVSKPYLEDFLGHYMRSLRLGPVC